MKLEGYYDVFKKITVNFFEDITERWKVGIKAGSCTFL
jgi:hypothetical protein